MKKRWIRGGIVAFVMLLMVMAGCMMSPVYYLNDDVTMRSIISGAYTGTPDGHAVYMKYPLTWLLAGLYRVSAGIRLWIPWFDLFMAGCILLAGIGILSNCLELAGKGPRGQKVLPVLTVLSGILVFMTLLLPQYLYMHYTIIAAILAGTALFLWETGTERVLPLLLLGLCYLVRSQVFFLSIPFLLVVVLDGLLKSGRGEEFRRSVVSQGKTLLILFCVIAIFGTINRIGYGSEEWQTYGEYNDSRTALYDYTDFLSTDRYRELYTELGLSEEQFAILSHYDTLLDQSIDADLLEDTTRRIQELKGNEGTATLIKQGMERYYLHLRYDGRPYSLIWMGCYILLGLLLLIHKRWDRLLLLVTLAAGRSLIWIYLIVQGRFPERIWVSLYLIEILLLLGMLLEECLRVRTVDRSGGKQGSTTAALLLTLMLLGVMLPGQLQETCQRVKLQQDRQTEWALLTDSLAQEDDLYLIDVFSAVAYAGELYKADDDRLMMMGGWLTASPLAKQRLEEYDAKDAAEALKHPQVRLIAAERQDITWLQQYLEKRLGGSRLEVQQYVDCGENAVFAVYQLME